MGCGPSALCQQGIWDPGSAGFMDQGVTQAGPSGVQRQRRHRIAKRRGQMGRSSGVPLRPAGDWSLASVRPRPAAGPPTGETRRVRTEAWLHSAPQSPGAGIARTACASAKRLLGSSAGSSGVRQLDHPSWLPFMTSLCWLPDI